jgi:hypothetical protein
MKAEEIEEIQICRLINVDYENRKCTFKMHHDFKVSAGTYVLIPIDLVVSGNTENYMAVRWIKTEENPPKDGQHILGWRVYGDEGYILPMEWNIHCDTPKEFPYYMDEPRPPKF